MVKKFVVSINSIAIFELLEVFFNLNCLVQLSDTYPHRLLKVFFYSFQDSHSFHPKTY